MGNGITFRTVKTPADFALFSYDGEHFESPYYLDGRLVDDAGPFFPELFLDLTVTHDFSGGMPDHGTVLVHADGEPNGWELVVNRYGYLEFRAPGDPPVAFRAPTPLSTFATETFRLALVLVNVCYLRRDTPWWREALTYSRVLLFGARSEDAPLRKLGDWPLESPGTQPVPAAVDFPEGSWVRRAEAWNTIRYELFEADRIPADEHIEQDFPDASRVFPFIGREPDTLDVFTGPELVRSDSYWVFTRIVGAKAVRTRVQLHLSLGFAGLGPGMAPRFFWSKDRENWQELPVIEPTDQAGRYYPLVEAPAESFYLSTSVPFMQTELTALLESVETNPLVRTETVGTSVEGRPISLLHITDPDVPDDRKVHVYMTIGQHSPMEMVGAHFIHPMIDYFEQHAEILRSLAVHCVPVVNVDCAAYGGDGMNMNLWNTNRCWFENLQPETRCIIEYLDSDVPAPDLFLDLHAGGCWRNHTLLRIAPEYLRKHFGEEAQEQIDAQTAVNDLLEKHAGIRTVDGMDFRFRRCSARDLFKTRFPNCIACTLELSICTYFDPVEQCTKPVDQRSLGVVGSGLAVAFAEFAKVFIAAR